MGRRARRSKPNYQKLSGGLAGNKEPVQRVCMNCTQNVTLYHTKQQAEAKLKEGVDPLTFRVCFDGTINMLHLVPYTS